MFSSWGFCVAGFCTEWIFSRGVFGLEGFVGIPTTICDKNLFLVRSVQLNAFKQFMFFKLGNTEV